MSYYDKSYYDKSYYDMSYYDMIYHLNDILANGGRKKSNLRSAALRRPRLKKSKQ